METLSNTAKQEKNKLSTDSVFLIALDIRIPDVTEVIRIVNNNENIVWNGKTYQAFPFELKEFNEATSGEVSEFTLEVGNANNVIGTYIRQYDAYVKNNGFQAITVSLHVLNTNNLSSALSEITHETTLTKPTVSYQNVTFLLGGINAYNKTIHRKMYKNNCAWNFKGVKCGYIGTATTCNKTLARCKQLSNQKRFGGFPTIGNRGISL